MSAPHAPAGPDPDSLLDILEDTMTPEPEVRVTRYDVSCLPSDDINVHAYTLTVEWRGGDIWAVMDGPFALNADGVKDYEPRPSSRDDEWLATHRFDLDTALKIAKKAAPLMTVNGLPVAGALAMTEARRG
ncbi:hypothetical protein HS041_12175 [Planomonospora sp. ID67723]|uniref:hypothetical protein n=1 Tax=Planomonospora sp. ID67723 TaxID=2738134 RepID=UPI0018C36773|nr:hypothetical protein [Planomonospora sp. ID67723]MBG0828525.1 hypothetical protein [Planomonospora sp. ID67723]